MMDSMNDAKVATTAFPIPPNIHAERVVSVRHYSNRLFTFNTTRPQSLRFRSGEFAMIGLPNAEKPLFRAYSIASAAWNDELEFFSIKVPNGPLTEHLQKIAVGDTVLLRPKTTGTLVLDALTPAKRLFLISTGTGFAPFASILREPETYEKFEHVYVTHTCRDLVELHYSDELVRGLRDDPLIGELVGDRVTRYATTTRESSPRMRRITDLIANGAFYRDLALAGLSPATDRVMICGSMNMIADVKTMVEQMGFNEGSVSRPGDFVVERAFVG